ncbi:MAG: aminotransferase class V-fold PLP-dependent enzyme [Planctomycetes bacterium]|nr:aminotransferase class V-fold PLP-dependent enzyme [Planctomycetota bacterium]
MHPPAWPLPDPDVHAAVAAALASGAWGQYHGENVCALEAELAAFHEVPHALTCASGTVAVEAALRALRVGPGDEVVMASYDYESAFLTLHALNTKPVLIDVRADNWQLDETKLEAAITPQTKAVICSHLHGGIVNMPAVMEVARKHGIGVVEDAAQAPGATVFGKAAGTWGDVGTLSFGGSKLLTAGRGGALLCADPATHQRAKTYLHRGLQQWAPLSELQAAALRPQLRKLRAATAHRAARVGELLAALGSEEPSPPTPFPKREEGARVLSSLAPPSLRGKGVGGLGSSPAFYKLGFQYDPTAFGLSREAFVKALRTEGVAFDAGFKALHVGRSPSRFRAAGDLTHAADAHARCVVLHHPVLSGATADVLRVAEAIARAYRS